MDQLSITAWLPALVLVGNSALLLALSNQEEFNFSRAIDTLTAMNWGAIVVLLFAVIIAAVFLQAFEFEILRFFEGYHRWNPMARWASKRIAKNREACELASTRATRMQTAAFEAARNASLGPIQLSAEDRAAWDALEKVVKGWELTSEDRAALGRAADLDWPTRSTPELLHAWDVAQLRASEFPEAHRILPTRLGNAMRAAEDEVQLGTDEDLEGFIIRHYHRLPPTISEEHDAYRGRLEMYLALVVVSALLALMSAVCLWRPADFSVTTVLGSILTPLVYAGASWLCYRAAIASALGFGVALREANSWVLEHPDEG